MPHGTTDRVSCAAGPVVCWNAPPGCRVVAPRIPQEDRESDFVRPFAAMRLGLLLPQGYFGEFDAWDPARAWERILAIAALGEELGFDSVWTGEHVLPKWDPAGPVLDCVTLSTAVAARVSRVEIGFVVLNATFRNAAMTAKMAGTLDAVSGGRLVLGLGAGFKASEAVAFGFDYPELPERLRILGEHFEIISQLARDDADPVSFAGAHARVEALSARPATAGRDHIPLLIGGHGRNVTFRLAARYCDEININVQPPEFAEGRAVLFDRLGEVDRDPATLVVSASINPIWPYADVTTSGRQRLMTTEDVPPALGWDLSEVGNRVDELVAWRELGIDRLVCGVPGIADSDDPIHELIDHLGQAGLAPLGDAGSR